jgi:NRAMP (natural resistance-associated macrophage protein)-like metal ion transporter
MNVKKFFRSLGPGVITGAADDDPSGIATYSQTGAQFGYGQLWTALYMLPFQIAIQEACARIGAVTGKGIAAVIKENYSKKVLYAVAILLLIANTINIGADLGAMAAAAQLVIPVNFIVLLFAFTTAIILLEIFVSYRRYAKILKWLALSLLAYPITVFMVKQPWLVLLSSTVVPHIQFDFQFLFIITGVLGTTISPYLFFWQASEEVEDELDDESINNPSEPVSTQRMWEIRRDNFIGMFLSEVCTWSIIVVAATVLHANGVTDIQTAADAAKALEPFVQSFPNAGYIAKLIFATGIIGLGLLAIPVLAASAAYVVAEAVGKPEGLSLKFSQARVFYAVIIVSTCIGLLMNMLPINPLKALVYAAVINGVVAVPLIFIIALIAKNKKIMGEYQSGWLSSTFVWATFIGMGIAAIAMFFAFKS